MTGKICRACGGRVEDDFAWIDLDGLGRFWLCPTHKERVFFYRLDNGMWMYDSESTRVRFVLGPYFYDTPGSQQAVEASQQPSQSEAKRKEMLEWVRANKPSESHQD